MTTLWQHLGVMQVDAQNTMAAQRIVATAGQTELALTTFAYVLGASSILVFKNGAILAPNVDFSELTTTKVTLIQPAVAGDVYIVVGFIKVHDATAQVEAIYEDLKSTYLGAAASDPTLDGLGNPVQVGALYYNTSSGLRVKTAGGWQVAGIPITGTLLAANNLSELANLATARENLGVRLYSVNVSMANDISKKVTIANTAALVGAKILAAVIAVQGDTLNDELEFTPVQVVGNCTVNGQVTLFVHADGATTNTFTVSYLIQN